MNNWGNNFYQPQQPQTQMPTYNSRALPHYEAPLLHGRAEAEQFPMGPNSVIYLPDADNDIIWWIRTDNFGNKVVIQVDATIHQDPTPVDINNLATRIAAIEEILNNAKQNKSNNAKRRNESTTANVE